jgi:DNA-binding transcriptional MerR regulator
VTMIHGSDPEAERAVKSAAAFRTISEVAQELEVPQHVLRFWETKFTQVKPLKRGGGRRYYRPEDVVLLRRIRQCLYQDGYTIKGVQRLLREGAFKSDAAPPSRNDLELPLPPTIAKPAAHPPAAETLRATLAEVLRELEALRDLLRRG